MNVEMKPVQSSNVDSVGYCEGDQELYVKFHSGATYVYSNVPLMEYEGLMSAPSVGSYLHRNVRNSYPYRQE